MRFIGREQDRDSGMKQVGEQVWLASGSMPLTIQRFEYKEDVLLADVAWESVDGEPLHHTFDARCLRTKDPNEEIRCLDLTL